MLEVPSGLTSLIRIGHAVESQINKSPWRFVSFLAHLLSKAKLLTLRPKKEKSRLSAG